MKSLSHYSKFLSKNDFVGKVRMRVQENTSKTNKKKKEKENN